MVHAAKTALSLHIFILFLIVCEYQVQQSISPNQFVNCMHHEIVLHKLQKSPRLLEI